MRTSQGTILLTFHYVCPQKPKRKKEAAEVRGMIWGCVSYTRGEKILSTNFDVFRAK
jgi:hypothetical protein